MDKKKLFEMEEDGNAKLVLRLMPEEVDSAREKVLDSFRALIADSLSFDTDKENDLPGTYRPIEHPEIEIRFAFGHAEDSKDGNMTIVMACGSVLDHEASLMGVEREEIDKMARDFLYSLVADEDPEEGSLEEAVSMLFPVNSWNDGSLVLMTVLDLPDEKEYPDALAGTLETFTAILLGFESLFPQWAEKQ